MTEKDRGVGPLAVAGLIGAPILAALVYFAIPEAVVGADGEVVSGLSSAGRAVAAVGVLMAALWLTEALPVPATALIPLAAMPLLTGGELGVREVAAPYAHPNIYLFMGGFMIALAMQTWGLHRRLALRIILLVGTRPRRVVLGFMTASAALSMWISNTATTVMMLPIALSVIALVRRRLGEEAPPPGQDLPLCSLPAARNGLRRLDRRRRDEDRHASKPGDDGLRERQLRPRDHVRQWLPFGFGLSVLFLPLAWIVLTRVAFPLRIREVPGGAELIRNELRKMGPMSGPEKGVLAIFAATAALWTTGTWLARIEIGSVAPFAG